ncbi:MAG: aminoacyl-tRNA hydrolase [Candidatus Magasanikbacteria bacterium]|nr:aminoacyl-tRNA hydrolase [Candidatus Magasanikbacteria bacterium]
MILIVGLGNPLPQYAKTRHNLGWQALDFFLKKTAGGNSASFKLQKKFRAEIAKIEEDGEKIILAKPQTFMNNSGEAVNLLCRFFKIEAANLWVVHDDADLPFGAIKIQKNRSAAGHQGVQSVIEKIKTANFVRFRLGIGSAESQEKPLKKMVLENFTPSEKKQLPAFLEKIYQALRTALKKSIPHAMSSFN